MSNLKNINLMSFAISGVGLLAIFICLVITLYFPASKLFTYIAMVSVVALYLLKPYAWLTTLPIFIVLIDLAPWTGAFLFNEFDIYILMSIGVLYLRNAPLMKLGISIKIIVPLLFILLVIINIDWQGVVNYLLRNDALNNPYYSEAYTLKVGKGFLYGFLLSLVFSHQVRENAYSTLSSLFWGGIVASILLFVIVLWERGTLAAIFQFNSIWSIANSLLDFTSSYRVTGLFSDMHTGGEAYDGVVLLLIPLNLCALCWFSTRKSKLLSLMALFSVSYCVLVGYTRTTYFAAFIEVVSVLFLYSRFIGNQKFLGKKDFVFLSAMIVGAVIAFRLGGYMSLLTSSVLILGILSLVVLSNKGLISLSMNKGLIAMGSIMLAIISWHYASESRWVEHSLFSELALVLIVFINSVVAYGYFASNNFKDAQSNLYAALSVIALAFVFSVIFGSYQFGERMKTIEDDIQIRLSHWTDVLRSSQEHHVSTVLGNGLGSFPINYAIASPESVVDIGSFKISNSKLIIGKGSDLILGQRLDIEPNTEYQVVVEIENNNQVSLNLGFCERNLIYASNFTATCSLKYLKNTIGNYKIETKIESKAVGKGMLSWPSMLTISNRYSEEPLIIDAISVTKLGSNVNLVKNNRFEKGINHWFFYNDFSHLPWHIKNTYLSVYYQLGVIGCILLFLLLSCLQNKKDLFDELKILRIMLLGAILGFGGFGFFGDPFDSAKVSSLFFMLLLSFYQLTYCPQVKPGR
ncbi:hypothetical protein HII17_15920 [Thalassotalea sp. M1531]|uniref:Uncharacterized protein n=1 Tax=Thalassotalea algicola TaxID=2716224 RepID=A0A7Y0LEG6_9GAMM|nr:hypothetical protein [Thalassotalea algicola]NMP33045.1 hypothetical protein [Thalassotalea algicola]